MTIEVLESIQYDPAVNLATEEYLFSSEDYRDKIVLFLWQNDRSVIIGKNQNIYTECNVDYAKQHGIKIVRRKSGGGAVYHDLGNLNITFIYKKDVCTKEDAIRIVLRALEKLGIKPQLSGRNDITVEGRKIAGMAAHEKEDIVCFHGCMMVDVNQECMYSVLNVHSDKIASKGIKSVRSRTRNLSEYNRDIDIDKLKEAIVISVGNEYQVSDFIRRKLDIDLQLISELVNKYDSKQWNYSDNERIFNVHKRFNWGDCGIAYSIVDNNISNLKIYSDSLDTDVFEYIEMLVNGRAKDTLTMEKLMEEISRLKGQKYSIAIDVVGVLVEI